MNTTTTKTEMSVAMELDEIVTGLNRADAALRVIDEDGCLVSMSAVAELVSESIRALVERIEAE